MKWLFCEEILDLRVHGLHEVGTKVMKHPLMDPNSDSTLTACNIRKANLQLQVLKKWVSFNPRWASARVLKKSLSLNFQDDFVGKPTNLLFCWVCHAVTLTRRSLILWPWLQPLVQPSLGVAFRTQHPKLKKLPLKKLKKCLGPLDDEEFTTYLFTIKANSSSLFT